MSDPPGADPQSLQWPGLRAKLLPVQAIRLAGWSWPRLTFRNWYHGHWWNLCVGPWMIWGGVGRYE